MKIKLLKWFGHVVRMKAGSKPRQIVEARIEGRRTRGKPRKINVCPKEERENGT